MKLTSQCLSAFSNVMLYKAASLCKAEDAALCTPLSVAWCLSVCLLVTTSLTKTAESIDLDVDLGGTKEPCVQWPNPNFSE